MTSEQLGTVVMVCAIWGVLGLGVVCVVIWLAGGPEGVPSLPPAPPGPRKSPKDCPLCGGAAVVRPVGAADDGIYWVECTAADRCCLQGPTAPSRPGAIADWDRLYVVARCAGEVA